MQNFVELWVYLSATPLFGLTATLVTYLLAHAYWPSTCRPDTFLEIYGCSGRLGEQRGWVESTLMTWLWSTPILVALEILRRVDRFRTA